MAGDQADNLAKHLADNSANGAPGNQPGNQPGIRSGNPPGQSSGNPPGHSPEDLPAHPGAAAFKSRGGLGRIARAARYSWAGLRAAVRHEAAFRQELLVGLPLLLLVPFIAPGRWQGVLMAGSVVAVWVVELLNSAVEAVCDAVSTDHHPLIGRAKDIGSAAVMLTLLFAGLVWLVLLWP